MAGLWLAGEMVNRIGIYGSKVAEGLSAFQRRSCFQNGIFIFSLFTMNEIFWYETASIQWTFHQHCGYCWPGALTPVLIKHTCIYSCLRVKVPFASMGCHMSFRMMRYDKQKWYHMIWYVQSLIANVFRYLTLYTDHIFQCLGKIFLCGISKVPFEIPHIISYPYIKIYAFSLMG